MEESCIMNLKTLDLFLPAATFLMAMSKQSLLFLIMMDAGEYPLRGLISSSSSEFAMQYLMTSCLNSVEIYPMIMMLKDSISSWMLSCLIRGEGSR